jgi:hypothetical protein
VYEDPGFSFPTDGKSCNYCNGDLNTTPNGGVFFTHDENCTFNDVDGEESEND